MSPEDDLGFVGKILDNVHGFIYYTEAEKKIMDELLFKRLQSIKQLSLVNWVFPGSEHTRFIHSLGVMHIADRMALTLKDKISKRERRIIRLAGLLHDIGHYPLSHVCEFPYRKKLDHIPVELFRETWNQKKLDEILKYQFKISLEDMTMKDAKNCHHEEIGAQIIRNSESICNIITAECGDNAVDIICDMITGNVKREIPRVELLVQILHSELDADGLDYLLRDAVFSGTSFGSFELDMLIDSLCVKDHGGKEILCITPKGIAAADQYLINKFFSYSQVVFNRHTSILEWMAEQIVSWMQETSAYFPSREELHEQWTKSQEKFLAFTDDFFWHSLRNIMDNPVKESLPQYILALCKKLLNHQELDFVENSELKIVTTDEKEFRAMIEGNHITDSYIDEDSVVLFSDRVMSKHIPIAEFQRRLEALYDNAPPELSKEEFEGAKNGMLIYRLMEGICVDDGDLHLLCDDKRSLMQQLYGIRLLLIRKYRMPEMSRVQ